VDGFDTLQSKGEPYRDSAYHKARSTLAKPRSCHFQIALGAWIEHRGWRHDVPATELSVLAEPASLFAPNILTRLHRKVIKQGRHFKALKREELHQLRLRLKKLRYAADFFLPLFDSKKVTRRYARQLAQLQDHLGTYNDVAVTADLMTVLTKDAERRIAERAIGAVAGWLARDQAGHEAELQKAWRKFRKASPPWPTPNERAEKAEART
jgi:CHAD domain-containing protein